MKMVILNTVALVLACTLLFSCKKNDAPINISSSDRASALKMAEFFAANSPKQQKFTIDASTGGVITLASGTKIIIPSNSFVTQSGSAVTGNVDIYAKDILKASDMILADKPTVTTNGSLLESFGEIIAKAEQNGSNLQLNQQQQRPPMVQVPIAGVANGAAKDIPMWDGDTTISQTTSGHNHENTMVSVTQQVTTKKGVAWTQIPGFGTNDGTTTIFPLNALNQWRNCDALNNDPRPKTTVLGYFGDKYNSETGNNYVSHDPTMLFFKTAGINTLVKLYNAIFQPAAGKEGLLSYQNSFPIGLQGTFLAISAKNGKFYAEIRDVTIPTPDSGKNYVGYTFNLVEVSETQLLNLINQMNTK